METPREAGPAPPRPSDVVVPFLAGDGFGCNLIHARGGQAPTRGPVLLVHGAGVRANLFRPPAACNLVDYLLERGWDVWLENWRASIDFPLTQWTLDQAAVYDHPAAVRTVQAHTGAERIRAIIHCQGSGSFMMSAIAGLVPQVSTIVSNAVSLFTLTPAWSAVKLRTMVPVLKRLTPYLDTQWRPDSPGATARAIAEAVSLTHHECDNLVCRMVSFLYGSGHPAMWSHANLDGATHDWLRQEFARAPLSFFEQMRRCVERGHLVSVDGLPELPEDFTARAPLTEARFAFLAGEQNRVFLPEGQVRAFGYFDRLRPNYHSLHLLPNYSHLDVFLGKNAARDVFPIIVRELEDDRGQA